MKKAIKHAFKSYFDKGIQTFLPHVHVSCVVFSFYRKNLKILVQRLTPGTDWLLPGGYVNNREDLEAAVIRNLRNSGLNRPFLRQFKTFDDITRITKHSIPAEVKPKIPGEIFDWVNQRFITIGYYALVNAADINLKPGTLGLESKWADIYPLEDLAHDHAEIVRQARKVLHQDLMSFPVIPNLLPQSFTIPDLQSLFESILDRQIDRGSFRRKMINSGILEKSKKKKGSGRRPAQLYRLNEENYIDLLMESTKLGF